MGWIRCVCCEKFRHDFVTQTFAIISPVQHVLHQVSCSNQTIPNAPKHNKTHHSFYLRPNGVNRVRLLRKLRHKFVARTFALIAPVQLVLYQVSCSNETIPNAPKHYETHQNMGLGSNVVYQVQG